MAVYSEDLRVRVVEFLEKMTYAKRGSGSVWSFCEVGLDME